MTHSIPIVWHDLLEDPKDLPKTCGYYYIRLLYPYAEELCGNDGIADWSMMLYYPDGQAWMCRSDDFDIRPLDVDPIIYGSPNTPVNKMWMRSLHLSNCYSDECVVFAWAEIAPSYIPDASSVASFLKDFRK